MAVRLDMFKNIFSVGWSAGYFIVGFRGLQAGDGSNNYSATITLTGPEQSTDSDPDLNPDPVTHEWSLQEPVVFLLAVSNSALGIYRSTDEPWVDINLHIESTGRFFVPIAVFSTEAAALAVNSDIESVMATLESDHADSYFAMWSSPAEAPGSIEPGWIQNRFGINNEDGNVNPSVTTILDITLRLHASPSTNETNGVFYMENAGEVDG